MDKTTLVARVFYLVLVLPNLDPNGSSIPDSGHSQKNNVGFLS